MKLSRLTEALTTWTETLIVWTEPTNGVDMALSFQEAEGCAMIWWVLNVAQCVFCHKSN